jgi:hypothetical protein
MARVKHLRLERYQSIKLNNQLACKAADWLSRLLAMQQMHLLFGGIAGQLGNRLISGLGESILV